MPFISAPATILCILLALLTSQGLQGQEGTWTWMNGSMLTNSQGYYGLKGIPDTLNQPPARYQAAHWKDQDGMFWIFGGVSDSGNFYYNDLWKFDPYLNLWTWMSGSNYPNSFGIYGVKGIPSQQNAPPPLSYGVLCWYDGEDSLYLYGGLGPEGFHSNMWKYSIEFNEWVWLSGSGTNIDSENSVGKGVSSPENTPGKRLETESSWTYADKLWFSCGQSESGYSSSTWHFDLNTFQWTWIHGPIQFQPLSEAGIQGIYSSGNYPSSRGSWCKLSNQSSSYIFSGTGYNDMWEFNSDSLAWRYLGGSLGIPWFDDFCTINLQNTPKASFEMQTAEYFNDCHHQLWLFGGLDAHALWVFDLSENSWILIWGNPNIPIQPNYGEKGIPSLVNTIPNRAGGSMWSDTCGNIWVFGGYTTDGYLNDMWKYNPDHFCLLSSEFCCELDVSFRLSHSNQGQESGSIEIQVLDGQGEIQYSIDGGTTWHSESFFINLPVGEYHVIVRDEENCFFSEIVKILDLSVSTEDFDVVSVRLHPNPASQIISINAVFHNNILNPRANIKVIDMQGKISLISESAIVESRLNTMIDISKIMSGQYLLVIQVDQNNFHFQIEKV